MYKHHADDFKISAVRYYLTHVVSLRETCKIFGCSHNSLYRWVMRYKKRKSVSRKKSKRKPYKITNRIEKYILLMISRNKTLTLQELANLVKSAFNITLTEMTVYRILHKHKITRKRVRNKYYPESKKEREKVDLNKFYKILKKFSHRKTISIDETSIYLNMTAIYGRSKSGRRVIKKTYRYPYKNIIY